MYRKEPRSQINRQIVAELRNGESITRLCEKYGVTQGNVSQLRQRYVNKPTGLPHERKKYLALQDIKYSSLSYIVGPCCLPILCIIVCVYVNTKLLIYPLLPL